MTLLVSDLTPVCAPHSSRSNDAPTKDTRLVPGLDLRVLAAFEADVDEVLGPGDMLYLPPGFAHHGVAVTPCLTYSTC